MKRKQIKNSLKGQNKNRLAGGVCRKSFVVNHINIIRMQDYLIPKT